METEQYREAGQRFEKLVALMARLRGPNGCPWDREQTFDTIKTYLLEESYEVMDAVDRQDWSHLPDELGDLLLQSVFFAQMASEAGHFTINEALDAINDKLIRRHPHIFGDTDAQTADEVKRRWDEIKAEERKAKGQQHRGLLDGVPRNVPALVEAAKISSKAAGAGFDWPTFEDVLAKLDEELRELHQARSSQAPQEHLEDEVGDMLFVLVNIARFLKVDPEQALRRTNAKFRRRFAAVEEGLAQQGKDPDDSTMEEMEALWQQAKQAE
jgi:MazG family protein